MEPVGLIYEAYSEAKVPMAVKNHLLVGLSF